VKLNPLAGWQEEMPAVKIVDTSEGGREGDRGQIEGKMVEILPTAKPREET